MKQRLVKWLFWKTYYLWCRQASASELKNLSTWLAFQAKEKAIDEIIGVL